MIGNELGVSVVVDGVGVVAAEKERGQRIHFCAYCNQTLTRPCKKLMCQNIRDGKAVPEGSKTNNDNDDNETEGETDGDKPEVGTMIEVNVENGKGRTKAVSTFYALFNHTRMMGLFFY